MQVERAKAVVEAALEEGPDSESDTEKLNDRKQKLEQEADCIEDDLRMLREYITHDSIIDSQVCVCLDLAGT